MGTLTAATHDLDVMVVSFTGNSGLTDYHWETDYVANTIVTLQFACRNQ